jgi:ubiquinone/menaquinone biosynthesis C-methylase UbiE
MRILKNFLSLLGEVKKNPHPKILNMAVPSILFKLLYWYINTVDKKKEIIFMNYGYHDAEESIELHTNDEVNRYSIQLYHRLAKMAEIKDKDIVEVGSGRGGGIAYITKRFKPASALGIDLDSKAAKFGNKHYNLKGLSFQQGDAQHLDLADESVDIIFNVESSHRYPKMELFLDGVYRALKPGGHFLYTDFRNQEEMPILTHQLSKYDYIKFDEQFINEQVKLALEIDSARRVKLVKKFIPFFLQKYIHDFAGSQGSPTYKNIESGEMVYFVFCFQKPLKG